MKYIRFYLEYDSPKHKRKNTHNGNVFALFVDHCENWRFNLEGVGAICYHPNSYCASTGASWEYLRAKCKRISEKRAREIHPNLFKILDNLD